MMRENFSAAMFIAAFVPLLGCNDPKPEQPEVGEFRRTLPTKDCAKWSVSETRAASFRRMELEFPEDFEDPALRVTTPDGAEFPYLSTVRRDDAGWFFAAPVHPSPLEGGVVTIQLFEGERTCPPLELEIEPIPESDEDPRGYVTVLSDAVYGALERHGIDRAEAHDRVTVTETETLVDTSEPTVAPLLVAAFLLNHPDNPHPLVDVVGSMTPEDRALLAALLATQPGFDVPVPQPSGISSVVDCGYGIDVGDQESLSIAMTTCGRPACNVVDAYGDSLLDGINVVSTAAGNTPLSAVLISFTTVSVLSRIHASWMCATHPRELMSVDVTTSHLDLEEDFEIAKALDITVTAEAGQPFNIAGRLAQFLAQIFGVFQLYKAGVKLPDRVDAELWELAFDKLEVLFELLRAAGVVGVDELGSLTEFTVRDGPWRIDLTSLDYVNVIPQHRRVVPFQLEDAVGLKPVELYADVSEIVPKIEKFPAADVSTRVTSYSHEIDVETEPEFKITRPDALETVTFSIDHAVDLGLEWSSTSAQLSPTLTSANAGSVTAQMPTDEALFPVTVVAESLATGGLRSKPDAPPRRSQTTYLLGDIIAGPDGVCVESGKTETVWASVFGDADVVWSGEHLSNFGDKGRTAVFTAPMISGDELMRFDLVASATVEGVEVQQEISLYAGECRCWATFHSRGDLAADQDFQFDQTLARRDNDGEGTTTFILHFRDPVGPVGLLTWVSPTREIQSGTYVATLTTTRAPAGQFSGENLLEIDREPTGHYLARWHGRMIAGPDDAPVGSAFGSLRFRGVDGWDQPGVSSYCASELTYSLFEPTTDDGD